jgi:mono/diheme cytochrome c family protein
MAEEPAPKSARTPPPISGGTLVALRDNATVVASDPDLDAVWVVNLRTTDPPRRISLRRGDEPGRLIEDNMGHVHVVLRGGGAVVSVNPSTASVIDRRAVCPAPRGIAWNPDRSSLHVACAGGEFVTLPREGEVGPIDRLDGDLRDVAVFRGAVYVSKFRAATLHRVRWMGARAVGLDAPARPAADGQRQAVAWRTFSSPAGVVTLSQTVNSLDLGTAPTIRGYYGSVTLRTTAMVPMVQLHGATGLIDLAAVISDGGLTVDVAVDPTPGGTRVAIASPGWSFGQGTAQVREWIIGNGAGLMALGGATGARAVSVSGQAVAVTYTASHELVVQTRAPARIVFPGRVITLSTEAVRDPGHDVFQTTTLSGLACASCHPEGTDDGVTWNFVASGLRRTPSLRGGILRTAPFHWSGDIANFDSLASLIYTARMGGGSLRVDQAEALGRWIDTLPALPAPTRDAAAVARGEALFRASDVGCVTCHDGTLLTNNQSFAVGTGGEFQVPPLVNLAYRAPYMHNGCAPTLMARFTDASCGGGDTHGHTAQLSTDQLADLIAYLETR